MAGKGELTDQQARFVEEYLVDCNGTQAAVRAGYKPSRARKTASELLDVEHVQKAIQAGMDRRSRRVGLAAEDVLEQLRRVVMFDPRKLFDGDGNPLPVHQLDDETVVALAGIEVDTTTEGGKDGEPLITTRTTKYKLAERLRAIDLAGKHLKLFADQIDVNLTINLADEIARRRQQVIEGRTA